MLKTKIAQKIKQLRKEKKLSQKDIARILGCNNGFICQAEKGKSFYNLEHIEKICAALNYPVAKLFEDDVNSQEEQPPSQLAQNQTEPGVWALVEIFKGLSSAGKVDVISYAGNRRFAEAPLPKETKKVTAAS